MKDGLPVRSYRPGEVLDSMLAHILCAESPMDARIAIQKAKSFTLPTTEKTFTLLELSEILFLTLLDHSDDILILEELCGIDHERGKRPYFNYVDIFYNFDSQQEIEFIAQASSQEHMEQRYMLLAMLDSLFSIANIFLLEKVSIPKESQNFSAAFFRESFLLTRNLSLIYFARKLKDGLQLGRRDGVQDPRFLRFSKRTLSESGIVLNGYDRDVFSKQLRDALRDQEEALNERFYDIIRNLFERVKEDRSRKYRESAGRKEFKSNMAEVIYNFLIHTPCTNSDQFKRLFGLVYNEDNPCVLRNNQYYVDGISYKFCRRYINYTNREIDEPVPDSSFQEVFKAALDRLATGNKEKLRKFTK